MENEIFFRRSALLLERLDNLRTNVGRRALELLTSEEGFIHYVATMVRADCAGTGQRSIAGPALGHNREMRMGIRCGNRWLSFRVPDGFCTASSRTPPWRIEVKVCSGQKFSIIQALLLLFAIGLALPGYALLETIGRQSGKPRRTPVGDGPFSESIRDCGGLDPIRSLGFAKRSDIPLQRECRGFRPKHYVFVR
jgi:hypothetical protein